MQQWNLSNQVKWDKKIVVSIGYCPSPNETLSTFLRSLWSRAHCKYCSDRQTNKRKKKKKLHSLLNWFNWVHCMIAWCVLFAVKIKSNTVIKGVANNRTLAEWYNNIVRRCQCCRCRHHRRCNCLHTHGVMLNGHNNRLPQTNQRSIAFIVLFRTLFKSIKCIHVLFARVSSSFVFLCKFFFH